MPNVKLVSLLIPVIILIVVAGCGTNIVVNYPTSTTTERKEIETVVSQKSLIVSESASSSSAPTTSSQESLLDKKDTLYAIPQWKVSFALPKELSDLMYQEVTDPNYQEGSILVFTTKSLIVEGGKDCDLGSYGGLGYLVRTKKIPHPIVNLRARFAKEIHKIGDYYYYYLPKNVACSSNDKGSELESFQNGLFSSAINQSLQASK